MSALDPDQVLSWRETIRSHPAGAEDGKPVAIRSTTARCSGVSSTVGASSTSGLGIIGPVVLEGLPVDLEVDEEPVRSGGPVGVAVHRLDVDLDVAGRLPAQGRADLALHPGPVALVQVDLAGVRLAVAGQHVEPVRRPAERVRDEV